MGVDNTFSETNFNPEKVKPRFVIMWNKPGDCTLFNKDFSRAEKLNSKGERDHVLTLMFSNIYLLHMYHKYTKANAKLN